jgi:uncharacterized protein
MVDGASLDLLRQPWPWYVAGPALGLIVPLLLVFGGRRFGLSSSFRHLCAIVAPRTPYFQYDVAQPGRLEPARHGRHRVGGLIGGVWLADPAPLQVADATTRDLAALGVAVDGNLAPAAVFSFSALLTPAGFVAMVVGGFLVGFGARWANGCTSGHAIMGLAEGQRASLLAASGFFVGGLLATHLIWPLLLGAS